MKQVVQDLRGGKIRLEEVPSPSLKAGGVLVANRYSVISSGTERAALEFAKGNLLKKARSRPDLVKQVLNKVHTDGLLATYRAVTQRLEEWTPLGYSCAGTVIEVAGDVADLKLGDTAACSGSEYASHAEVVWVPVNLTASVPSSVPLDSAAFSTLGAIALHGVHRAGVAPGHKVGVIGLGLIGLLAIQILKAYGCEVVGLDLSPARVALGKDLGLDLGLGTGQDNVEDVVAASTGIGGLDSVIITAATPSSEPVDLAGRLCRQGGTVCVVGDVGMQVSRRLYYEKELDLVVARSYGPGRYDPEYELAGVDYPIAHARWTVKRNMEEFLRLMAQGKVKVAPLIGRRYPIAQAEEAYEVLHQGNAGGAIVLEYPARTTLAGRLEFHSSAPAAQGSVGVGLIGAGSFARGTLLRALKGLPSVEFRGAVSSGGTSAAQVAQKLGFKYAATSSKEILDDPEVKLVVIATRHNLHPTLVVDALGRGKDVFVEKPLAIDLEGLRAVAGALNTSKNRLMVGFNRRFAPLMSTMRSQLREHGPLLITITVNAGSLPEDHWLRDPQEGGGRILGEVCHFVDLASFLAGSNPRRVYAQGGIQGVSPDDFLSTLLEFADGSRATIVYSGLGPDAMPKERVEAVGKGVSAILDNFRALTIYSAAKKKVVKGMAQDKGHGSEMKALIQAIIQGTPSPVPPEEYLWSTLATLCIPESLRTGQPVEVDLAEALQGQNSEARA